MALDEEQKRKIIETIAKFYEEEEKRAKEDKEPEVCGECFFCGGQIIEDIVTEYNPITGPIIFGPGSKNQFRNVHKGFYCWKCGLMYKFVPRG